LQQQHKELQQQQQKAVAANGGGSASSAKSEQQRIRELYQRLYPEAVKAQSGNALQASFDQWLEQVLATHVKQQQDKLRQKLEAEKPEKQSSSSSHKSTQSNNNSSSNHNNSTHNNISSNNSSSNSQSSSAAAEQQELHKQNLQLRECNDKLTQLVTKTVRISPLLMLIRWSSNQIVICTDQHVDGLGGASSRAGRALAWHRRAEGAADPHAAAACLQRRIGKMYECIDPNFLLTSIFSLQDI